MTEECEHELNLTELDWFTDNNTVSAEVECQKCKQKFKGVLTRQ